MRTRARTRGLITKRLFLAVRIRHQADSDEHVRSQEPARALAIMGRSW